MRRLAVSAVLLAVALTGCATHTTTTRQVVVSTSPLPPGTLSSLVLQPNEAPDGSSTLAKETGPATLATIASFSSNPSAARAALTAHGFSDAYVAEYADLDAETSLVVSVVRFTAVSGADAQIVADLASVPPAGSTRPTLATIGARSGELVSPAPGAGGNAQLVTVRFRVGRLDYLVAATGPHAVDPASVATIARTLAMRAAASPLSG